MNKNFRLIEIKCSDAAAQQFQLPINQDLEGKLITKIITIDNAETTYSPSGRPTIPTANFKQCFITLKNQKQMIGYDQKPLSDFNRPMNGGVVEDFMNTISFQTSFIFFASALEDATKSVLIGVYWED